MKPYLVVFVFLTVFAAATAYLLPHLPAGQNMGTRWHFKTKPLTVHQAKWEKQDIVLKNDPALWRRSWSRNPKVPGSLNDVLATADSYGFSFVGFKEEVTGKFSMDQLEFRLKPRE